MKTIFLFRIGSIFLGSKNLQFYLVMSINFYNLTKFCSLYEKYKIAPILQIANKNSLSLSFFSLNLFI